MTAAVPVIDVDLVRRLVGAQFPAWAELPIAAVEPDGWDNRTFRLGRALSVRLPSAEPYALQVEKEHRWLPWLAPQLPLPVPVPVARGGPGAGYPFGWSVYAWLDGVPAAPERIGDHATFGRTLAEFLRALRALDATGGPAPGAHNFHRGAPVGHYAEEALAAIDALDAQIARDAALAVWDAAVATSWDRDPVWFHGDVAAGNLLLRNGELAAVIDFGTAGVGDPAGDVVVAWTLLRGPGPAAFRAALGLDAAGWARGRGWALWKAAITLVDELEHDRDGATQRAVIDAVLADHDRAG